MHIQLPKSETVTLNALKQQLGTAVCGDKKFKLLAGQLCSFLKQPGVQNMRYLPLKLITWLLYQLKSSWVTFDMDYWLQFMSLFAQLILDIRKTKTTIKNEPVGVFQFCFQFWEA